MKYKLLPIALLLNTTVALGQKKATLVVDLNKKYQKIDNFGASDAWACQFTGKWPEAQRNKLADLLFSQDTLANGDPKGIGLSLWRFNIGAGSTEQGRASGIRDEWRRAECFMDSNGNYDWEKQAGQMWFLKAAKLRKVSQFLAFNNSPPVFLTRNRKAYADSGRTNLLPDRYADYGRFLSNVVKGVAKKTGVRFDYVSPVNEPQWDWSDGGQEGSPFTNAEIAGLFKAISNQFKNDKLDTKILVGEAGSIQYTYTKGDKPGKGEQAKDFFGTSSANYLGNTSNIANIISAHSYFTTSPRANSIKQRTELAQGINLYPKLKYWQSEYCILGDNAGEINGNGRDLGIKSALYLARVIHDDLTVANASAWQWWTAISRYDYKDGLIYIDPKVDGGDIKESKMLWVLGNFSRFIRPGAVRVNASIGGSDSQVYASAYKHGKKLIVVVINESSSDKEFDCRVNSFSLKFQKAYCTSASANLSPAIAGASITLPAQSITTLTANLK